MSGSAGIGRQARVGLSRGRELKFRMYYIDGIPQQVGLSRGRELKSDAAVILGK